MPAYVTHYLFAQELMDTLRQENHGQLNEDAVYLGTQGPDIFFFHRILPTMPGHSCRKIGSAMHRTRPSVLLDAMAQYVRDRAGEETALSYAYGFICHYALDRVVHPFVYGVQHTIVGRYPMCKGFTVHNTIEFSLDNVMLADKLGQTEPWLFDTASTVPDDPATLEQIGRLLSFVIPAATGKQIEKRQVIQALRDTKQMQKSTNDQTGRKTAVLHALELLLSPVLAGYRISVMIRPRDLPSCRRYVNQNRGRWENPNAPGVARHESFYDLYDRAKEECLELIHAFQQAIATGASMHAATEELSFLTGMPVAE